MREIKTILKKLLKYQNNPATTRNGTFILLYSKVPKHPTHLNTIQTDTVWSQELRNIKELLKKLIESEKNDQNISTILQYWKMRLSFYYIPESEIYPPGVTHLNTIQTATVWSVKLGNIIALSKKTIESEKITKTSKTLLISE